MRLLRKYVYYIKFARHHANNILGSSRKDQARPSCIAVQAWQDAWTSRPPLNKPPDCLAWTCMTVDSHTMYYYPSHIAWLSDCDFSISVFVAMIHMNYEADVFGHSSDHSFRTFTQCCTPA